MVLLSKKMKNSTHFLPLHPLRAAFQAAWQSYKQDFSLRFEMGIKVGKVLLEMEKEH
jgi:hypothetical protein